MAAKSVNSRKDTKNQLIDAAVRMFGQNGYQKTRISDIVSEAGVAQGTFYLYFRSKEEIFRTICTDFMDRFSKRFESARELFNGRNSEEVRKNVNTFIRELLVIYRDNALTAEMLFREGTGQGGLFRDIYEDIFTHFIEMIKERIEYNVNRGIFTVESPEAASVFMIGMFERSMFYYLRVRRQLNVDRLAGQITDFILDGLFSKSAMSS